MLLLNWIADDQVGLLLVLAAQALDRVLERLARRAHAIELGVRPAQVADRLEVVRILRRARLELLRGLEHLTLVIVDVSLVLVGHPLHDVLNAARAVRVARPRRSGEEQHAHGRCRHDDARLHRRFLLK
jgi:hypothetical protein